MFFLFFLSFVFFAEASCSGLRSLKNSSASIWLNSLFMVGSSNSVRISVSLLISVSLTLTILPMLPPRGLAGEQCAEPGILAQVVQFSFSFDFGYGITESEGVLQITHGLSTVTELVVNDCSDALVFGIFRTFLQGNLQMENCVGPMVQHGVVSREHDMDGGIARVYRKLWLR